MSYIILNIIYLYTSTRHEYDIMYNMDITLYIILYIVRERLKVTNWTTLMLY